jgi:hypothetical protein
VKSCLIVILALAASVAVAQGQTIDNKKVIEMKEKGVSIDLILEAIQSAPEAHFTFSTDDFDAFSKAHLGPVILKAMYERSKQPAPPPTPKQRPETTVAKAPAPNRPAVASPKAVHSKGEVLFNVVYDGGSLSGIKTGTDLNLTLSSEVIRFLNKKAEALNIPPNAITEISYGQDVHRRVGAAIGLAVVSFGIGGLMALSKSKKHFIGITWAEGDQKGGLAMQCSKNEYRGILAALEGLTGIKAVDSSLLGVKN